MVILSQTEKCCKQKHIQPHKIAKESQLYFNEQQTVYLRLNSVFFLCRALNALQLLFFVLIVDPKYNLRQLAGSFAAVKD